MGNKVIYNLIDRCDQMMEYNRSMDDHNQDLMHKIHIATDEIH